jgi:hypothetical protein
VQTHREHARTGLGHQLRRLLGGRSNPALPAPPLLALPSPEKVSATVRGWLASGIAHSLTELGVSAERVGRWINPPGETRARSAKEYDFAGFKCPCCGDARGIAGSSTCGHMTCRGTVEYRPGGTFWRCSCGDSGFLTESLGSVKELRAPSPLWLQVRPESRLYG